MLNCYNCAFIWQLPERKGCICVCHHSCHLQWRIPFWFNSTITILSLSSDALSIINPRKTNDAVGKNGEPKGNLEYTGKWYDISDVKWNNKNGQCRTEQQMNVQTKFYFKMTFFAVRLVWSWITSIALVAFKHYTLSNKPSEGLNLVHIEHSSSRWMNNCCHYNS